MLGALRKHHHHLCPSGIILPSTYLPLYIRCAGLVIDPIPPHHDPWPQAALPSLPLQIDELAVAAFYTSQVFGGWWGEFWQHAIKKREQFSLRGEKSGMIFFGGETNGNIQRRWVVKKWKGVADIVDQHGKNNTQLKWIGLWKKQYIYIYTCNIYINMCVHKYTHIQMSKSGVCASSSLEDWRLIKKEKIFSEMATTIHR